MTLPELLINQSLSHSKTNFVKTRHEERISMVSLIMFSSSCKEFTPNCLMPKDFLRSSSQVARWEREELPLISRCLFKDMQMQIHISTYKYEHALYIYIIGIYYMGIYWHTFIGKMVWVPWILIKSIGMMKKPSDFG